ncbi:Oidioi.mRNA.OKI2018_I69.PAR.g12585.t1.cds [Oikopleura dioica]|uniref:Oidioi.mRNA.OKI2018_I69.PAR.g12585.t1.cds n=1 Tax=Oikopleura dioica TaxID=34765 RepID=A0ABN7S0N8_OIKDI|nr:Oidioi.mRNA.OKI2018_I69.PAR.g12585.t1.cds [Oikopleura dioica]
MKFFSNLIGFLIVENRARRPNVILINCDDFGIGDFQIYNKAAKVPTPNIDRLGKEGIKFLDGHSASSRCAPRYKTGLFGKEQPLNYWLVNRIATAEDRKETERLDNEFKEKMNELGKRYPKLRTANDFPGIYEMKIGPQDHHYDYSFTNSFICCQPGGFYENGKGIEPVDTWVKQRPFPEHTPREASSFNPEWGGCTFNGVSGYMGGPGQPEKFDEETEDLPIYFCNFPRQQLVMKSFDTRNAEEMTIPRLEKFIDDNHEDAFFVYYGMRSGHGPFNTPLRFRNKTEVGSLGEMIMETDEIIGKILNRLEEHGIADDTLVMFMSDNGPASFTQDFVSKYDHNQRQVDLPNYWEGGTRTVQLKGKKNTQAEAGHRTPFLWRYPRRFAPKTLDDPKVPVSTVDIYATLAELIDYDLGKCLILRNTEALEV